MQMYSVYFLFVHLSKLFTYQPVKLFRFLKYANRDSQCTLVAITVNLTRSFMCQMVTFHFRLSTGFERDTHFT